MLFSSPRGSQGAIWELTRDLNHQVAYHPWVQIASLDEILLELEVEFRRGPTLPAAAATARFGWSIGVRLSLALLPGSTTSLMAKVEEQLE